MAAFTDFAEAALSEHILSGVALSMPSTWWVAFHVADPTDAGTANEASTSVWENYARQPIARTTGAWSTAAPEGGGGHRKNNAAELNWGNSQLTSQIQLTHVSLWDSSSGGNAWFQGALTTEKIVQNGDPVTFPSSALGISLR